jgi:hypothetical protein
MAETSYAPFSAATKEFHDGEPFVVFETYTEGNHPFDNLIGLHLRPGVTAEQADALAKHLNECVERLAITTF